MAIKLEFRKKPKHVLARGGVRELCVLYGVWLANEPKVTNAPIDAILSNVLCENEAMHVESRHASVMHDVRSGCVAFSMEYDDYAYAFRAAVAKCRAVGIEVTE